MGSKFDLEKLLKLTEECHEVTVMWFGKDGRSLGDSNGEPTLMHELLQELEVRRTALYNMKVDEAMLFVSENQGKVNPENMAVALKMTVEDAEALMIVLRYADMIERRSISKDN